MHDLGFDELYALAFFGDDGKDAIAVVSLAGLEPIAINLNDSIDDERLRRRFHTTFGSVVLARVIPGQAQGLLDALDRQGEEPSEAGPAFGHMICRKLVEPGGDEPTVTVGFELRKRLRRELWQFFIVEVCEGCRTGH